MENKILDFNKDGKVDISDFLTVFEVFLNNMMVEGTLSVENAGIAAMKTAEKLIEHN